MAADDKTIPSPEEHMICDEAAENKDAGETVRPEGDTAVFDCRKNCMHCGTHCIYLNNSTKS